MTPGLDRRQTPDARRQTYFTRAGIPGYPRGSPIHYSLRAALQCTAVHLPTPEGWVGAALLLRGPHPSHHLPPHHHHLLEPLVLSCTSITAHHCTSCTSITSKMDSNEVVCGSGHYCGSGSGDPHAPTVRGVDHWLSECLKFLHEVSLCPTMSSSEAKKPIKIV